MIPDKSLTPHVPIYPHEIIEQVHQAYEIGITIAHLHARDENQKPTPSVKVYSEIFGGIRKHCPDLIICSSTSGRTFNEFEKRSEVIELQPDMCSLTLSSLNFINQASVNSPEMIKALAAKMKQFGVHPELECFDLGMINYGKYLIHTGVLEGPFYWNLLFGNIAGFQARSDHFKVAVNDIPDDSFIGIGGIGDFQVPSINWAIQNCFGVRIGLEDNIWQNKKDGILSTNISQVLYVHDKIKENNLDFFTAKDFGQNGFYNAKRS